MLSRNGNLTTDQMLARLREGAVPFPNSVPGNTALTACHVPASTADTQLAECLCTLTTCGAGMANAANSVAAADRPIAAITVPIGVSAGQNVTLNAAASAAACNRSLVSYAWVVTQPTSNPPTIVGANTASATVIAPSSGSVTLKLTVTDDQNHSDSASVVVGPVSATTSAPASAGTTACIAAITSGPTPTPGSSTPAPTPTPQPSRSGSGGGGGSLEPFTLGLLGLLAIQLLRRRSVARFSRCI